MTINETTLASQIIPTVPTTDRLLFGMRLNHNKTVLRADRARRAYVNLNETVFTGAR